VGWGGRSCGRRQASCESTGRPADQLPSTHLPPSPLALSVAMATMAELRAITERLRRLELEDLVSISQAIDGAIPPELIAVVEGPQEIDYEEHANPQMLLWMEELRESGDLTPQEKQVVRMAQSKRS